MADCDLEDGELLDSDTEDHFTSGAQAQAPPPLKHAEPRQRNPNLDPNIYRDRTKPVGSSSNSDDDSDEEKFLWKRKRLKYAASKERDSSGDSKYGPADHSNSVGSWPAAPNKSSGFPSANIVKPKKKKDVWGAVLQEQTLSTGFIGFDMERKSKGYSDRSVEAYAYERAEMDPRPWFNPVDESKEPESKNGDLFSGPPDLDKLEENFVGTKKQGTKRKYPVTDRLGPRRFNKRKSRDHFKATASDSVKVVTEAVCSALEEPRNDLILNVVRTMGRKKTLELAYMTEDIEDSGGMLTNDGSRRRTPGGVFFQLLKTDPSFTKEKMKAVFGEEMKKEQKKKKKLRAKRFKQSLAKKGIPIDDGDTMETEQVDASLETDKPLNENNRLDIDCDDENSDASSRGSSDASNAPDPTTMDLTELLKHHVERRRVEEEEAEKKKAADALKEKNVQPQPTEMHPEEGEIGEEEEGEIGEEEEAALLEPDLCLDDESEMTFDL